MYSLLVLLTLGLAQAESSTNNKKEDKKEKTENKDNKSTKSSTSKTSSQGGQGGGTSKGTTQSKEKNNKNQVHKSTYTAKPSTNKSGQTTPTNSGKAPNNAPKQSSAGVESKPTAHKPMGDQPKPNMEYSKPAQGPEKPTQERKPAERKPDDRKPEQREPLGPNSKPNTSGPTKPADKPNQSKPNQSKPNQTKPSKPVHDKPNSQPNTGSTKPAEKRDIPVQEKPSTQVPTKPHTTPSQSTKPTKPEQTKPNQQHDKPSSYEKPHGANPQKPKDSHSTPNSTHTKPHTQNPSTDRPPIAPSNTQSNMKPGVNSNMPNTSRQTQSPKQEKKGISRKGQTSVGLGALAYSSGYVNGGDYSDGGMGISVGVRPLSFLEIEGSYGQYSDTGFSGEPNRLNRPLQAVGQIYFNPNQRVSPYITGGYAWNHIDIQDSYQVASTQYTAKQDSVLTGKVIGGGVELNLSKHFGVELDGRYFMYDNLKATQPAKDTASLVSVGLIVYF